jgi:hypothetical protein
MIKRTYSYTHLIEFCNNYGIQLLENYENINVTINNYNVYNSLHLFIFQI